MPLLTVTALDRGTTLAEASFDLACVYDRLRLSTYRDKGSRRHLIRMASMGSSTLLRFEDVGYFNRVSAGDYVASRLPAIERFFHGSPHSCTLVGRPSSAATLDRICRSRGWLPDAQYVWLAGEDLSPRANDGFEIRPPGKEEQES